MRAAFSNAPTTSLAPKATPSLGSLYALLLLMVFLWALNFIVGKVALREFPSFFLANLRVAVAGAAMLPLFAWRQRRHPLRITWRQGWMLFLLGAFGVSLNQIFFTLGLARTSVAHSSILIAMTPVQVVLLAAMIGQEKLTLRKVAGLAIAIGGVAVLQLARHGGSTATLAGDLLILLCGFALAAYTVFGKPVTRRYDTITMNTFAYGGGGLLLLPLVLWQSRTFDYGSVSAAGWLSMLYMAIFSSVVAYIIYNYALSYIPASRVSAFSYLQPLFATLMAIPLLHESLTGSLLIGGALVLVGVVLTERG